MASRTGGITAVAILNWVMSLLGIVASASMIAVGAGWVEMPATAEGTPAPPVGLQVAAFGTLRLVASLILGIAGFGLWAVRRWGRDLTLGVSGAAIVINVAEPLLFYGGFPAHYVVPTLLGSAYFVVMMILLTRPSWKAAFAV